MVLERRRVGSVEILTLNRPEHRNALSPELLEQLSTAFGACKSDDDVRVAILTAAGDKAFCAGMDLKVFAAAQSGNAPLLDPVATANFTEFNHGHFPKPVIGAANATAVGGGLELLMSCDLVVAADHARFGFPETKRGLYPAGNAFTLPARIPLAVALEMGLTGDMISAERALQLGLVNRVVPAADVMTVALELAERISANGPLAVAFTKKLMRETIRHGVDAAYALAAAEHDGVFKSEDAIEGARAFAEKRTPRWKGR
jgi:enoyl-CoA hydratase